MHDNVGAMLLEGLKNKTDPHVVSVLLSSLEPLIAQDTVLRAFIEVATRDDMPNGTRIEAFQKAASNHPMHPAVLVSAEALIATARNSDLTATVMGHVLATADDGPTPRAILLKNFGFDENENVSKDVRSKIRDFALAGDSDAIGALQAALQNERATIRALAARSLGEIVVAVPSQLGAPISALRIIPDDALRDEIAKVLDALRRALRLLVDDADIPQPVRELANEALSLADDLDKILQRGFASPAQLQRGTAHARSLFGRMMGYGGGIITAGAIFLQYADSGPAVLDRIKGHVAEVQECRILIEQHLDPVLGTASLDALETPPRIDAHVTLRVSSTQATLRT